MIFFANASRSPGLREVTMPPSLTTAWSSHFVPTLITSLLMELTLPLDLSSSEFAPAVGFALSGGGHDGSWRGSVVQAHVAPDGIGAGGEVWR